MKYRSDPGARLWPRLVRNGRCMEWTGCTNEHGYGVMTVDGRRIKAHRFAWIIVHGPIPTGMDVLHHCDNPPCCNVTECLFLGTMRDNMADMISKGRHGSQVKRGSRPRGEIHGMAKLTESDVALIRLSLRDGRSLSGIGRQLGVTHKTISRIRDGITWSHCDD
jgi:hypothetical protein